MWKVFNQFRVLLTFRDKLQMAGLLVLMLAGALLELAGVSILMPVVAAFTRPELLRENRYLAWFYERIAAADQRQFILILCGIVIVFFLLKNLYSLALVYLQSAWVNRKIAGLLERLFANYLGTPYAFHLEHDGSELQYRKSQLGLMAVQLLLPFLLILTESMVVLVILAMLLIFAPLVTLAAGFLIALLLGGMYLLLQRGICRWGRRHAESEERSLRIFTEAIGGIRETRLFGAGPMFAREFSAEVRESSDNMTRLYAMGQIPRLGIEAVTIILAMLTLIAFTLSGLADGTVILIIGLFVLAVYRLLPSFTRIHYNLMLLRQYSHIFTLIYNDLAALPQETTPEPAAPEIRFDRELTVRRLSFRYAGQSSWLFRDFSLTLKPFSSLALTGRTGCGKTTLADLIMGLLKPAEGEILVDGRNIRENLPSWQSRVGYVPQTIHLLNRSIRCNVAFGVPASEIDDERVWECLALAQIDHFVRSCPERLDTVIGERGARLSGGQRQRLGIARALYRRPRLLVLDEATSALDRETEQALVDAVNELQGKLTMIVIAHRLSTVEKCDMVLELHSAGGAV